MDPSAVELERLQHRILLLVAIGKPALGVGQIGIGGLRQSGIDALGGAEAIVFGGGIGEDEPMVRARVCRALRWAGVELDEERNKSSIFQPGRLSTPNAGIAVWTLPAAEAAQIAFESATLA